MCGSNLITFFLSVLLSHPFPSPGIRPRLGFIEISSSRIVQAAGTFVGRPAQMSNGSRSAFLLTSTATNVLFISVLIRFPVFLRHVKSEGADPVVVVRLATFYELNVGPFLLLIHRRRWPSRVTPNQP
jgi:hypothetical protein